MSNHLIECLSDLLRRWRIPTRSMVENQCLFNCRCRCYLHVWIARQEKEKKTIMRHVRRLYIHRNRLYHACLEKSERSPKKTTDKRSQSVIAYDKLLPDFSFELVSTFYSSSLRSPNHDALFQCLPLRSRLPPLAFGQCRDRPR
jgi:hypothetical protein